MKLLLIEDNKRLADLVKTQISKVYLVDVVHTGREGIDKATRLEYTVIILDLHLPDMTGLDICQHIRKAHIDTPILVLTANDEMESRVELLNCGADDYLTKPFNIAELQARIGALARRQQRRYVGPTLTLKDLVIDTDQRKVYRGGVHIPLRRKEFDILVYLVNNNGRVLTREMILNHAWDSNKDSWNSTVDVHIKHLRDKIDRPFKTSLIKTAYGLGYRVDAPE
jgi:DNA-binding response OmpR family regulator